MGKKINIIVGILLFTCTLQAQVQISILVSDSLTREPLAGVTLVATMPTIRAITDANGLAALKFGQLPDFLSLQIRYTGYIDKTVTLPVTNASETLQVLLSPAGEDLEEITISTTRTNSRIEDLPVKVEVLGAEELEEEASMVPGGMGSLLGDLSIITIQRTGPVSGNDAVRMQGLAPGYTQLLQDGMPLYGGFSGSLGVLNIPPLDLKQVEIIKGSSSTLYGGGAIGGLINFISKTPGSTPKSTVLLNQTTLGETNANAFFSRKTGASQGFTLLLAGTAKPARDLNNDGFAEIARTRQLLVHPRWFFGLGKKTGADIGFSYANNQLRGGDMTAIQAGASNSDHPFYQAETVRRYTGNGQIHAPLSTDATWTLRGAGSLFERKGQYAGLNFTGQQLNTYLETNVLWKKKRDDMVVGASLTTEQFLLKNSLPVVPFDDFGRQTGGVFAQLDHRFSDHWALQTGFRADHHSTYGWFALPRASLLYKTNNGITARLGYGRGYKTPDLFTATEPTAYRRLQPLATGVRPDVANSVNIDADYQRLLFDAVSLQVNQAFYYVGLSRPFLTRTDSAGAIFLENDLSTGRVLGSDTYVQLHYAEWEFYLGYNHTLSERIAPSGSSLNEPFNPQDKIAATLAWSIPDRWRFGLESAWTGNQYVNDGRKVPSFWFVAAMVARQFRWGLVVLNCENLGNARQAHYEPLISGTAQQPVFNPVWGPIEGRVVNLSVKVDW